MKGACRQNTSTGTVRQKVRRCGTIYTVPKDVIRLSEQYDKMLDATDSSTRRTIMLYYILYYYCITIISYTTTQLFCTFSFFYFSAFIS